jgi:hypothetical protein
MGMLSKFWTSHLERKCLRQKLEDLLSQANKECESVPSADSFLPYASFNPQNYAIKKLKKLYAATVGQYRQGTIVIDETHLKKDPNPEIIDTIKHEEAHAIERILDARDEYKVTDISHNKVWSTVYQSLGGSLPEIYYVCHCGDETYFSYNDFINSKECSVKKCKAKIDKENIIILNMNSFYNKDKKAKSAKADAFVRDTIASIRKCGKQLIIVGLDNRLRFVYGGKDYLFEVILPTVDKGRAYIKYTEINSLF